MFLMPAGPEDVLLLSDPPSLSLLCAFDSLLFLHSLLYVSSTFLLPLSASVPLLQVVQALVFDREVEVFVSTGAGPDSRFPRVCLNVQVTIPMSLLLRA